MKPISREVRSWVLSLLVEGHSCRDIARITGISKPKVSSIRQSQDGVSNNPHVCRPLHFSQRDERQIVRLVSSGQCFTAVQASHRLREEQGMDSSPQNVRRVLKRYGFRSRIRRRKPLLRDIHQQKRREFCMRHKTWTSEDWQNILWSDETKFTVFGGGGREYCWRKPGEPLQSHHIKPTVKFGGGSIMMWGCMTAQGVGFLCRIDGGLDANLYCRILNGELLQTLQWYGLKRELITFQHDNDPKHTANSTLAWLRDNKISVLEWPPQSPDLNPIEHLWSELDRRVRNGKTLPTNRDELWEAIEEEWNNIEPGFCARLVATMPERIVDVLEANGAYTSW
jgi:transposase